MLLFLGPPAFPLSHPFSGNSLTLSSVTPFNFSRCIRKSPSLPLAIGAEVDTFTKSSGYLFKLSESEAESLEEYDVARIDSVYRTKPLIMARRLFQIGTTFGKWLAIRYIDSVLERADTMFKVRAAELRKLLVELGPAYVKIAQAISSRSDLIPPVYVEELSLLQDRITPFPNEVAFRTIEQELGMPIDEIFSEISSEPVAAASLGQACRKQGDQMKLLNCMIK